ncbi:MAG: BGTF surface domain-containing protein, partial [Halobacteriota archaeon]
MTTDTPYRGTARAVFLAAIAVVSAVAVGFAAAPAVAQDASYDDTDDLIGELLWQGETVEVAGLDPETDVSLRESTGDGSRLVEELNTGDGTVEIDTGDLDAGDYFIAGGGSAMDAENTFEVVVQDLDVEFDEDSVESDETAALEIDSNRGTYSLDVSADGDLDDDQLERLFEDDFDVSNVGDDDEVTLNDVSDGTFDATFSNVDGLSTGEYEFTFDVTDTSAEDTASITVGGAGGGDLSLAEGSTTVARGDVAEITVEFDEEGDSGTVVIGDFGDDSYQANVSVEDGNGDGDVTVLFNTYTAGRDAPVVEAAAAADDATLEGERGDLPDLLDTGDYAVSVSPTGLDDGDATDALDDATALGSLVIEERSTDELVLWRTTDDVRGDVVEVQGDDGDDDAVAAVTDGVENDVVTRTDTAALGDPNDVLVHQIGATGLEGALAAQGGSKAEALADLASADALSLTFTEQDPGANRDADEAELGDEVTADDVDVVYDDENGDYYVFVDAGDIGGEDGDEYAVEFTVETPLLTDAESDDGDEAIEDAHESVGATFGFEAADGSFDLDPVEVANADGQRVSGEMNVAPGTEFALRVRSDEASTDFIKNAEGVVVQSDGAFSGEFDFTEESVNDTFTVSTRQSPLDEELESDGVVVEQVREPAVFEVSDLTPQEAT